MGVSKSIFIKNYTKAIKEGCAALFAGAGLSVPSGFVSWKELIRPLANEIGLSVDKEHDYLALAQYYYNRHGNRSGINNAILEAFNNEGKNNDNINIITRLPIDTYWTTNYDHLLEDALRANGRKPDVKITNENLATNCKNCSATVYKMHGDVQFPNDAVIIKDDYETYIHSREPFTTILKGHLLSKTFLFIGFSFEDPNLGSILSWIKNLLRTNVKEHYCLFEEVNLKEGESEEDFIYKKAKQNYVVEDLKRYGIQAVLLKSYNEIPDILNEIERQCNINNVFISGSMALDNEHWTIESAQSFSSALSQGLITKGMHITSGYGLGIGSAIINGVLNEVNNRKYAHFDEFLKLYPFPQPRPGEDKKIMWSDYRREMLQKCGGVVFIFGNKISESGGKAIAQGMLEEYMIAQRKDMILIPIASTGDAALHIYNEMYKSKDSYLYLTPYWNALKQETDARKLTDIINEIIESVI